MEIANKDLIRVKFLPSGIVSEGQAKGNLLDFATGKGIDIEATCGRLGTCGKCKVQIISGNDDNLDEHELSYLSKLEIKSGFRLACRVSVANDMTVLLPGTNTAQFRKTKMGILPLDFQEFVKNRKLEYVGKDKNEPIMESYGIAFDIGTTTVVGMLWNLESFDLAAVASRTNPQGSYGGDIISRINYANQSEENLNELREKICLCLNEVVQEFVEKVKFKTGDLARIAIVGNTTMSHLLLGITPRSLAVAPFAPEFLFKKPFTPREIMVDAPDSCIVTLLPNIAGHVGSDIVGVIIASRLLSQKGTNLAIDIGTNGEIVLGDDGKVFACSTAAGPAFEGVSIGKGMRASKGAIEGVKIDESNIKLKVIDHVVPIGICGSGLIDAISEMLKNKLVDFKGRLIDRENAVKLGINQYLVDRLRDGKSGREFVLYFSKHADKEDITITQKDIREVQLAKGAIYSGIKILLELSGKSIIDIDKIFIAGAFGNYIDKESALCIGLLPAVEETNIISIGNAACTGAFMTLLSEEENDMALSIPGKVEHVELAGYINFQDEYINAMNFPKIV
ncbi:MAG: ASKHA domain-containing protein [Eubacteriales bacterium]